MAESGAFRRQEIRLSMTRNRDADGILRHMPLSAWGMATPRPGVDSEKRIAEAADAALYRRFYASIHVVIGIRRPRRQPTRTY